MISANKNEKIFKILKLIEYFVLLVPTVIVLLLLIVFYSHLGVKVEVIDEYTHTSVGYAGNADVLVTWKITRDLFWYIYLALGAIAIFLFESMKPVNKSLKKKFIIIFVIGFLLLNFSYALTGIIIDLGWVLYFSWLKLSGQPLPFNQ